MSNSRLSLYLQSIRGPVLLMTLGGLCALHQAGMASFRQTWPVLIIVVGVLVLLERLLAPAVVTGGHPQGPAFQPPVYNYQRSAYDPADYQNPVNVSEPKPASGWTTQPPTNPPGGPR